jgi:hypothetical protein
LREFISAGVAPARLLTRARILLEIDTGEHAGGGPPLTDGRVAEMRQTSAATVGRVRERFFRQGLDAALLSRRRLMVASLALALPVCPLAMSSTQLPGVTR